MKRAELLQEIRAMRFEEAFSIWTEGRITQEEAARMLVDGNTQDSRLDSPCIFVKSTHNCFSKRRVTF